MPTGTKTRGAGATNGASRPKPSNMPGAKQVTRSKDEIRIGSVTLEAVTIDAETAKEWLELQAINRTLRKGKLAKMRKDLIEGKWRDLADPIRFDRDGKLCDGQHRLTALIQASAQVPGLTMTAVVARGISDEDKVAIDTGTSRTVGDQLRIAGYKNWNHLAIAARWCMFWERQQMYAEAYARDVTHSAILEYVEQNPDVQELTNFVVNRMKNKIDMPPGYVITAYRILRNIDADDADDFFERWAEGYGLERGSALLRLRQVLSGLAKDRNRNLSGEDWLSLVFRTWNAHRLNKPLRSLPVTRVDPQNPDKRLPIPIPAPI